MYATGGVLKGPITSVWFYIAENHVDLEKTDRNNKGRIEKSRGIPNRNDAIVEEFQRTRRTLKKK